MRYSVCMSPSEVIAGALNLILEKGWVQKDYITTKGYCLSGALSYSTPGKYENRQAFYDACKIVSLEIKFQLNPTFHLIEGWNDDPKRTKEDVVKLLDTAYEKALELENGK